jgi:predicted phosphodiesterase
LLLTLSFGTESVEAASFDKGPYLIYPGDNSQMAVLWQLNGTVSCTLEWGQDTSYSDGSTVTTEYNSDYQHKFTIPSLTPSSRYYYRVTTDSTSATGSFMAAPPTSATSVQLMAYGDTRSQPEMQELVNAEMLAAGSAYQTIILHSGDWVNMDKDSYWQEEWFDSSWPNMHEIRLNVPFNGCWGNHEGKGRYYEKFYPYPYVNDQYWSFDYGPVHVSVIDQSVSYGTNSPQYAWLENELATTDREWVFLVFHKPGYSAGGHANEGAVQTYIQPLCVQYGVDIVFAGHNHYYARTTADGIKHVTLGGGGAPLRDIANPGDVEVGVSAHHFCKVDISGTQLVLTAIDIDGIVIDSFTLTAVCYRQQLDSYGCNNGI